MKIFPTIILINSILYVSEKGINESFWSFSIGERTIISGNTSLDTSIEISIDSLNETKVYSFNLLLCGGNGTHNFTECYLTTKDSVKYITSAQETGKSIHGYVTGRRIKDVLEDSGQKEFRFQCKIRGSKTPWDFFKIRFKN